MPCTISISRLRPLGVVLHRSGLKIYIGLCPSNTLYFHTMEMRADLPRPEFPSTMTVLPLCWPGLFSCRGEQVRGEQGGEARKSEGREHSSRAGRPGWNSIVTSEGFTIESGWLAKVLIWKSVRPWLLEGLLTTRLPCFFFFFFFFFFFSLNNYT